MSLLKILNDSERKKFDLPPTFDSHERKKYFRLPVGLKNDWKQLRTPTNQVLFLIQLGYLRFSNKFFAGHFHPRDIEYVCAKLNLSVSKIKPAGYSRATSLRHQEIILTFYGIRPLTEIDEIVLQKEVERLVKMFLRPSGIFNEIVKYLRNCKFVIPSYRKLNKLISEALQNQEQKLHTTIENSLTKEQKAVLDSLIQKDSDESKKVVFPLTNLKNPSHSTKPSMIKVNLKSWQELQSIYTNISPILSKLNLNPQTIRYYARIVLRTKVFQIAQRNSESRYLHLMCFVAYQTFIYQDVLVDSLLKSVQNTINSTGKEYREKYFRERKTHRKRLNYLMQDLQAQVFPKFTDITEVLSNKKLSSENKLALIDLALNENVLERTHIQAEVENVKLETETVQDEKEFYSILENKSLSLQTRTADIIRSMQIDSANVSQNLLDAVRYFQQKDGNVQKNAPKDFLSDKEQNFLNIDKKKFPVSLYKVLLFQKVADGIKAGTVNFADSHKYRSLDDYLIPKNVWETQKIELLEKAGLKDFADSNSSLENLIAEISQNYLKTNDNINKGKNSHLKFNNKKQNSWTISTPKQSLETFHLLRPYFPKEKIVSLSEVLSTINQATSFLDKFKHLQITGHHDKFSEKNFLAAIIGLGCELGLNKIANISKNLKPGQIENVYHWYFSLENIRTANKQIVDFLNSLELPNLYRQKKDFLHTSSDGQKYTVSLESLNANFSYKYFGQKKGVSVYSFIDERNLLFYSTVISSSEREAAFVIDGLLHNEVIKSDIHSTDTHGYTEIVFGVTHLLGFTFAPRLKSLSRRKIYSFEKRKFYQQKGFKIIPDEYIKTQLIKENWDEILRFVATIKLKYTSASQLFKRLNSYSKQHPLYKALKEFGKIIKTHFILRYIDDTEFRQSITKQLTKSEHAQRFAKAIAFGNNQEMSFAEKENQDISAECRRLIGNSVTCWNYLYLTQKLTEMKTENERKELINAIKNGSIITWRHINFHGEYDFSDEKLKDSFKLNIPQIKGWKMEEKWEENILVKSINATNS